MSTVCILAGRWGNEIVLKSCHFYTEKKNNELQKLLFFLVQNPEFKKVKEVIIMEIFGNFNKK